jgi:GH15 family glucan-1,4-alpha-glucosidase
MRSELVLRFDYGHIVPWTRWEQDTVTAFAGPDTVTVDSSVPGDGSREPVWEFDVTAGEAVDFRLTWLPPRAAPASRPDVEEVLDRTARWWRRWARGCRYEGPYRDAVVRSLITLKALTFRPTGGIVAAPTTSLPESLGGVRNWDYRFCWIRDAAFTLTTLLEAGFTDEAAAWRDWLLRAVAGRPEQMQIMYGVEGERRLSEIELDWLAGYEGSRPVRAGNAAAGQFQLDVYGELMEVLHQARRYGVPPDGHAWDVQRELLDFVVAHWREPDYGIWEVRGPARHYTHSKVMAWVALDRAVKAVEEFGLEGPVDHWRAVRAEIHSEVCDRGFDEQRNTFTQHYDTGRVDAALLLLGQVGFLPVDDPRIEGTVRAVEDELCTSGLVRRYVLDDDSSDGLPPGEGFFLPCSFWLVDCYAAQGRLEEATALFERLLNLAGEAGLLSEEYSVESGRLVGNHPQALSHLALVASAATLAAAGSADARSPYAGSDGQPTRC